MPTDIEWMQQALILADNAAIQGEIPVGALITYQDQCIAKGWNQSILNCDPTAHAEIIALRQAAHHLANYRLIDTTLYVTLEPCVMCAGAILQARVKKVVFGAYDQKMGAAGSRFDILRDTRHNHHLMCVSGVLAQACGERLQQFFTQKRK